MKPGIISVKIYNILGQEVFALINRYLLPSVYTYKLETSFLSSGIYYLRLDYIDIFGVKY